MKNDIQVQKDVMAQLNWEPILNAEQIGVSVKNGVVTLTGIVDSYTKKITAERAVKKVSGVKAVAEEIQVGPSLISNKTDAEIAEAVPARSANRDPIAMTSHRARDGRESDTIDRNEVVDAAARM